MHQLWLTWERVGLEPFDMPKKRDEITFAEKVCVGWMSRKSNVMDRWSING